jgi:isocitrate dehydrogenase
MADIPIEEPGATPNALQKRFAVCLRVDREPVLRETIPTGGGGGGQRFAQKNPHRMMKPAESSKSRVVHMTGGDFYGT